MIRIADYVIDIAVTEEHGRRCEVTRHEVEKGASLVDHVRVLPATVSIEGCVSDTPLGAVARVRRAEGFVDRTAGILPSDDAHAFLVALMTKQIALGGFTIETSLDVYDDMIIETLTEPRSKDTTGALRFTATFVEIRYVTNDRAVIPVASPRAARSAAKGTKAAPDAALVPTEGQSIASRLIYGTRYGLVDNLGQ